MCLFGVFSSKIVFRSKAANINYVFIALPSFKSLFLVKFQASTLDQSHHLLVKLSCKNGYENLDAISARYALQVHDMRTIAVTSDCRSRPYTKLDFRTPTSEVGLPHMLRAYKTKMWLSSNS